EGTRRINWSSTRHGRHKLAKVAGATVRWQRHERRFEHRTSGEGHQKDFRIPIGRIASADESNCKAIMVSTSLRAEDGTESSMPRSLWVKLALPPVSTDARTIFAGIAGSTSLSVGHFRTWT